jgi:molecular chaperone GrpE
MTKQSKTPKQPKVDPLVAEAVADLQRLQAEFINFKRRSEEERTRAVELGKEQIISGLLPIFDNLERALAHEPADIKDHAWVKGVSSVAKQLESQLAGLGLVKIGVVGEQFDPSRHDAVAADDNDGETEVIGEVLQPGYELGGQIIRHAMVKVTKN